MAKNYGKLATRYARAFLSAVEGQPGLAAELSISGEQAASPDRTASPARTPGQCVAAALAEFVELWRRESELPLILLNPMFDRAERAALLAELVRRSELPPIVARFLDVLFERDRLRALPEISQALNELADQHAGVVRVEVITAQPLDAAERGEIEAQLRRRIPGQPLFDWRDDREILGGMVLRYGGKVVDGSVAGKLSRLEQQLTE